VGSFLRDGDAVWDPFVRDLGEWVTVFGNLVVIIIVFSERPPAAALLWSLELRN